jgi:arylsulfatase A-like enzyme
MFGFSMSGPRRGARFAITDATSLRRGRPTGPTRSLALLVAALLLASCRDAAPPPLEVATRLIDVGGPLLPAGVVRECEIDAESRPALGCVAKIVTDVPQVRIETETWRARIATPAAARGRAAAVDGRLRDPARPSFSRILPLQLVADPLGDELEVDLAIPAGDIGRTYDVEIQVRPVPLPVQVFETEEVEVPRGAWLEVGLGLDPVVRRIPAAPVEFVVAARAGADDVEILRDTLDPAAPDVTGWRDHRVSLEALGGRRVRFQFRTRALADPDVGRPPVGFPLWGTANVLAPSAAVAPRNVVLISLDTLRADHLGVYGSALPTSPEIDALAGEGAVFENVFATWPSTTVSHMSMLTGLYPSVFVDRSEMRYPLSRKHSTLAEAVARGGLATAAVTEDGYVVTTVGFARGFDSYRENRGISFPDTSGEVAQTFADGLEWIREHRDQRFFVFLHTYQVHTPYTPPPEHDIFSMDMGGAPATIAQRRRVKDEALYAGEVVYTDAELGKFVASLAELGVLDSTVLIITADHGEAFGEHDLFGHSNSLYDELLHVPLIVRAPGLVPAGTRVDAIASLVDLVPTVLDVLGLPALSRVSGHSLLPHLTGSADETERDRAVFAELHRRDQSLVAVRRLGRKWILDLENPDESITFDLAEDPGELHPSSDADLVAVGESLRGTYATAANGVRAYAARSAGEPTEPAAAPDDETTAKLRVLGYLE